MCFSNYSYQYIKPYKEKNKLIVKIQILHKNYSNKCRSNKHDPKYYICLLIAYLIYNIVLYD